MSRKETEHKTIFSVNDVIVFNNSKQTINFLSQGIVKMKIDVFTMRY